MEPDPSSATSRPTPVCYAALYPFLVTVARQHGYALAIHGSMARDFDLIAVPWVDAASEPGVLIEAFRVACDGSYCEFETDEPGTNPADPVPKPHGRQAYLIGLSDQGVLGPYLDVSVLPRQ